MLSAGAGISSLHEGLASHVDAALGDGFAFDGARCDRIVASVLSRASADGLSTKGWQSRDCRSACCVGLRGRGGRKCRFGSPT